MEYPKVNNSHRVYIVSNLFEVTEVISIPKVEKQGLNIHDEKFVDFMVWEHFGNEENTFKVGDKIKLEMDFYRCLKQIGPIPYTPYQRMNYDENLKIRKAFFDNFASNFNPELVKKTKEELSHIANDDEVSYRCFYNSFKMYRCRDYVFDMSKMLISLAEQKEFTCETNQELMDKFKELQFDHVLIKSLESMIGTHFAMNRNDQQAWFEDSQKLFSAYFLFSKAVDYMVRFCERISNQDLFLQSDTRRCLDWDEAGAMMVWEGISFLRSCQDKDLPKILEQLKK